MNQHEQNIVEKALLILDKYQKKFEYTLNTSFHVVNFLRLKFELSEREIFSVLFLNNQYKCLACEEMFYGTINQVAVFPREVVKRALALNAAAVILTHNHPSGCCEVSEADCKTTIHLQQALNLVDIKVVDHIIIASGTYLSFAERKLL